MGCLVCGRDCFADFDQCAEHIGRAPLLAAVIRLNALLSATRAALADERARHENHNPPPAQARGETTILERM